MSFPARTGSYNANRLYNDIRARWSDQFTGILDDSEGFHSQIAFLAGVLRRACLEEDRSMCIEILAFIEDLLARADLDSEFENAVAISFIEEGELVRLGLDGSVPPRILAIIKDQANSNGSDPQ